MLPSWLLSFYDCTPNVQAMILVAEISPNDWPF